jgi:arylsulfatase
VLPTLTGRGDQARHDFLYWEFPSYRGQQAVIAGDWKAVRQQLVSGKLKTELYDLKADEAESKDVAASNPEVVKRLEAIMVREHTPSALFPLPTIDPVKK